jgi:hypothetical protein
LPGRCWPVSWSTLGERGARRPGLCSSSGASAPRGVAVDIATQDDDETVSFWAKRFDRARGATIYTLNLPGELASHASAASDLARLCALAAMGGWTARPDPNAHGASRVVRSTHC